MKKVIFIALAAFMSLTSSNASAENLGCSGDFCFELTPLHNDIAINGVAKKTGDRYLEISCSKSTGLDLFISWGKSIGGSKVNISADFEGHEVQMNMNVSPFDKHLTTAYNTAAMRFLRQVTKSDSVALRHSKGSESMSYNLIGTDLIFRKMAGLCDLSL